MARRRRLEQRSRTDARPATRSAALLTALGIVVILGTLLFGLVLVVAGALAVPRMPWLGISMVLGGLATILIVGFSLRRPERDEGHATRLGERDAPTLFAEIERLRQAVGGPRIDVIAMDDEFNAGVIETRRFELIGRTTRTMRLGLPLMSALSPDEMRFVIGHEIAHLSRSHGRSRIWSVRVAEAWSTILDHVHESDRWTDRALRSFATWYLPRLATATYAMRRANEYEADRLAAAATSPVAAGSALCALGVRGGFLDERFWPAVWRHAGRSEVTARPFGHISGELRRGLTQLDATRWLREALAREPAAGDTHPPLRARLSALGVAPTLSPPPSVSAAQVLFGPALAAVTARMDADWGRWVGPSWQEARRHYRERRDELDRMLSIGSNGGIQPSAEDLQRIARLVTELHGEDAGRRRYEDLLARFPGDPVGLLHVGAHLLDADDQRGIAMIEQAMATDLRAVNAGSRILAGFHHRHGRLAEVSLVLDRARTLNPA